MAEASSTTVGGACRGTCRHARDVRGRAEGQTVRRRAALARRWLKGGGKCQVVHEGGEMTRSSSAC